jgi:hypothetical protein
MLKFKQVPRPMLFFAAILASLGELYSVFIIYGKLSVEKSINIDFFLFFSILTNLAIFIIFFLSVKNIYWRSGNLFYLSSCAALLIAKIVSNISITFAITFCYFSTFLLIPAVYCFLRFIRERVN